MLHSTWKNLFPVHILQRGKEYYEDDRIINQHWCGNTLISDVEGSELYTVSVTFSTSNGIESYFCDCPYGEDGTPCKHLAAVLFSFEDDDSEPLNDHRENQSIEELVDKLSEAQMRTLLIQLAMNDQHIYEKIRLSATKEISNTAHTQWAIDLRRITNNTLDRHGFINYEDAYDYCCELAEFLEDRATDFIEAELFDEAFELVYAVFQEVTEQEMDDSDGGQTMVVRCCEDFWTEILEASDLETHKNMLHRFRDHCYDSEMGEMFLMDYIFDAPWNIALSKEILRLIDDCLAENENLYYFEILIIKKLHWMMQSNADGSEIADFIKEYDYLPEIVELQVSQALREHDYKTAQSLLEKGKAKSINKPGLAAKYSEKLIQIYETTGDTSRLKDELEYHIFNFSQNNLHYVQKVKLLLSQTEWEDMRSHLLNSPSMCWQRFPLLEQEGLYEEMMMRVEALSEIYTFERYEHILMKEFPQRCINWYVRYLQNAMNCSYDRNAYRSLMQTLKKLLKYPNGKTIAQQIADGWKQEYPRRPALLDEIKKAGF